MGSALPGYITSHDLERCLKEMETSPASVEPGHSQLAAPEVRESLQSFRAPTDVAVNASFPCPSAAWCTDSTFWQGNPDLMSISGTKVFMRIGCTCHVPEEVIVHKDAVVSKTKWHLESLVFPIIIFSVSSSIS